ncbi:hypothetical protein TNCV_2299461 [Trichonephila clavipes]|nr:hypothetical protein TNCV_2299461 [Trichonephila clavipes]
MIPRKVKCIEYVGYSCQYPHPLAVDSLYPTMRISNSFPINKSSERRAVIDEEREMKKKIHKKRKINWAETCQRWEGATCQRKVDAKTVILSHSDVNSHHRSVGEGRQQKFQQQLFT